MAKGTPNDSSMQLNFVAKVWDETAGDYRPIYIAPDATDKVRGDVYLSDATNGTDNAATGVTAATPKAVKDTYDAAVKNNITTAQTMQSDLTPKTNNTLSLGTSALKWANIYATTLHGALDGNASTASKLQTGRKFKITNGTTNGTTVNATAEVSFTGEADVNLMLTNIDASTVKYNTLPLSVIPQGALERLIHVPDQDARFKLTTDTVQLGDTVQQDDTKVMYVVVDESKLNSEAGYVEYSAGSAVSAQQASKLNPGATIQTDLESESAVNFTGESGISAGITGTLPISHGGTGAETADEAWTNLGGGDIGKLNSGSGESKYLREDGTWQTVVMADKWTTARSINLTGNVTGSIDEVDGSDDISIETTIADEAVTSEKIADSAVNLAKLASDIQTVYVGSTQPTDPHVTIWIQP